VTTAAQARQFLDDHRRLDEPPPPPLSTEAMDLLRRLGCPPVQPSGPVEVAS